MTITDVRYYYYRDDKRQPRITLCVVRADDGRIGYGWSICSQLDVFHKEDYYTGSLFTMRGYEKHVGGKTIARGRAEVALAKRGRGIPCQNWVSDGMNQHTEGVLGHIWRYARDICRDDAKRVINVCVDAAEPLYRLTEYGDVRGLPTSMRPEAFTKPQEAQVA